jgi:GT2 family glycosyltransferase
VTLPVPSISVVIPAHDAASTLTACLAALLAGDDRPDEIVVVDDRSSDATARLAADAGARVISSTGPGPAAARNTGAEHAVGDVLLFVDADVVVHADTVGQFRRLFGSESRVAAAFGSYDARPPDQRVVSRYKNLLHHWVHQQSAEASRSFWAGCGAVRAAIFRRVGGFDAAGYPRPSIEDIELGVRLSRAGFDTVLVKTAQATHLKSWRLRTLVVTDVRDRAYPWARLMMASGVQADLNLQWAHRASGVLAWVALAGTALWLGSSAVGAGGTSDYALLAGTALGGIITLNRDFYMFLARQGGWWFAVRAVPLHVLYYLYASAVFAICAVEALVVKRRGPDVPAPPGSSPA